LTGQSGSLDFWLAVAQIKKPEAIQQHLKQLAQDYRARTRRTT
jgi:hypothetical protein